MDDRKKIILKAIVDDYVKTCEPVGSKSLVKRHNLNYSSATIRNEMAELEEMGFLVKPHTSAGRMPSDRGYRAYVDNMLSLPEFLPRKKSPSDIFVGESQGGARDDRAHG